MQTPHLRATVTSMFAALGFLSLATVDAAEQQSPVPTSAAVRQRPFGMLWPPNEWQPCLVKIRDCLEMSRRLPHACQVASQRCVGRPGRLEKVEATH